MEVNLFYFIVSYTITSAKFSNVWLIRVELSQDMHCKYCWHFDHTNWSLFKEGQPKLNHVHSLLLHYNIKQYGILLYSRQSNDAI